MTTVQAGHKAPDFTLHALDGGTLSLSQALQNGPVLLAFYKVSCPICQFGFPYIERIFQSYGKKAAVWGISQHGPDDTRDFQKEYGLTFPAAVDPEDSNYHVSNLYGLTNVPTVILVAPDGTVKESHHGFDKKGLERIGAYLAKTTGLPMQPVFVPGEAVPDYKPG